jgi:hypothetical protein
MTVELKEEYTYTETLTEDYLLKRESQVELLMKILKMEKKY